MRTENYGISRDGTRVMVSSQEGLSNLMLAEQVPGIAPQCGLRIRTQFLDKSNAGEWWPLPRTEKL